jgi:lipopolysaccharide/colanic/teichoic acid biosynthesis glycosyltransferase
MRRLRIDELPQVINVLRGKMSLIGLRPDYIEYARDDTESMPA